MKFGNYIKACRKRFHLTQDELVEHLYHYDDIFSKLDGVTLSRWERGITCPNLHKQKIFIESLRQISDDLFPCFDLLSTQQITLNTATLGISKIIGKHPRYMLDFPKDLIESHKINIKHMKETDIYQKSLKLTYELHKKITNDYAQLTLHHFQDWASHPRSLFLLAQYEEHFFGMLFSLSLKKTIFTKLLEGSMQENEITQEHFAEENEKSDEYLLGFFSYSEEATSHLMLAYYHYLMKEQKNIEKIGVLVKIAEGHALSKTLGLKPLNITTSLPSPYASSIGDVILNPNALTIFFEKFIPEAN